MSPALLIAWACALAVSGLGFALIGLDNWSRGNRGFALGMLGLAVCAAIGVNGALDRVGRAYAERAAPPHPVTLIHPLQPGE